MRAMAIAPGSSASTRSNAGSAGAGRPRGTSAMSATPRSSSPNTATSTMPPATAISGPGIWGSTRPSPSSTTIVPADSSTVAPWASPRWRTAEDSSAKNESPSGTASMPSTFGSCPAATVRPTPTSRPVMRPVMTASEMLSTSGPSRNSRAASSTKPVSSTSVDRSASPSAAPVATPAATSVEAVSVAMIDVVLTLRMRDPPSSAYTAIGTMQV